MQKQVHCEVYVNIEIDSKLVELKSDIYPFIRMRLEQNELL